MRVEHIIIIICYISQFEVFLKDIVDKQKSSISPFYKHRILFNRNSIISLSMAFTQYVIKVIKKLLW